MVSPSSSSDEKASSSSLEMESDLSSLTGRGEGGREGGKEGGREGGEGGREGGKEGEREGGRERERGRGGKTESEGASSLLNLIPSHTPSESAK